MFSQTAEYALRSAVFLAAAEGHSSPVRVVSRRTQVPASYLTKILGALGRAGIVRAQRGPNGGYVLSRPPDRITALDVIRAVEPRPEIDVCPLGLSEHAHGRLCSLHRRLADAYLRLEAAFESTSLQDLAAPTTEAECAFPGVPPTSASRTDTAAPVPLRPADRKPRRTRGTVGEEETSS